MKLRHYPIVILGLLATACPPEWGMSNSVLCVKMGGTWVQPKDEPSDYYGHCVQPGQDEDN